MKFSARGFTLVELLVVIAIMGILGIYVLANYSSFGEDQNLKSAVLNIQSILKQAQTSATTNAVCSTQYGATWQVVLSDTTINLKCQELLPSPLPPPFSKKTLIINEKDPNLLIQSIAWTGSGCPVASLPYTINFTLLNGKIDFGDANCTSLKITLINNQISPDCAGANAVKCKSLNIEQGGRIYAP